MAPKHSAMAWPAVSAQALPRTVLAALRSFHFSFRIDLRMSSFCSSDSAIGRLRVNTSDSRSVTDSSIRSNVSRFSNKL